jgi:hypothetical protein
MDPGSYIVTSPDNTYPRGKHGEIKVHRSNACGLNVFQTSFMLDLLSICFCRYIRCPRVGFLVERLGFYIGDYNCMV